jgi:hypothetical protein
MIVVADKKEKSGAMNAIVEKTKPCARQGN